jgi:hypothetical protein
MAPAFDAAAEELEGKMHVVKAGGLYKLNPVGPIHSLEAPNPI